VVCVNPDGSVVRIDDWQNYPPRQVYGDSTCPSGSHATCGAFKVPPLDVWFQYMTQLQVASLASIQAANLAAAIAYANAQGGANPGTQPGSYNGGSTGGGATAARLTFTTSRGGSTLQPGDGWVIQITGAAPNSQVTGYSMQPNGQSGTSPFGNTDSQGNFRLTGTVDASSVGNWQETWYVGGQSVGSFSFTVAAGGSGGGSSSGGGSGGITDGTVSIAGTSIPVWALAVGLGALFLMGGKR